MKILVLQSDKTSGLNFVKCLQMGKSNEYDYTIYGTSSHPCRTLLTENDHTIYVDPKMENPAEIVQHVQNKTKQVFDLVYQCKSAEHMLSFSEHRNSYPTFLPLLESVEIFENKYITYEHLKRNNFPVPYTKLLESEEDVKLAFSEVNVPEVWVRDISGQGGRGSFESRNINDVIERVSKNNGWGYVALSEKLPTKISHPWSKRLSSEMLPGEMFTWIALYDQGSLIAAQTRKRLYWEHSDLTTSGVTGYTGANMTISNEELHNLSDSIVNSFEHSPHGAMGIDFLIDRSGKPLVTEIQASRFFTSTYQLAILGLNLPKLYVDIFRNKNVPKGIVNPCPPYKVYIQRFGANSKLVDARDILISNDDFL